MQVKPIDALLRLMTAIEDASSEGNDLASDINASFHSLGYKDGACEILTSDMVHAIESLDRSSMIRTMFERIYTLRSRSITAISRDTFASMLKDLCTQTE